MPRIVASIEARMQSSRLPGKVLMDIAGQPVLTRLYNRLKRSRLLDDIVLATSTEIADDPLEKWAEKVGANCFRGSENDVLDRVVSSHEKMRTDIIVEVTGDCPLIDYDLIDLGIETFLENDCDVVSNVRKQRFPLGVDVQVFKAADLKRVAEKIHDPYVREHVSIYFYEHPELYKIIHMMAPQKLNKPEVRLVLDYFDDLQFIRKVYQELEPVYGEEFGVNEIIALLSKFPSLLEINSNCLEKAVR